MRDGMKILFGLFKLILIVGIIALSTTYGSNFDWWNLVIIVLILILSDIFLTKKIEYYTRKKTLEKYPMLNNINEGDRISAVLINGEKLSNIIYFNFDENRIYVYDVPSLYGKRRKGRKAISSLKIKKIKSIKVIDE